MKTKMKRLLIVDDDRELLKMLKSYFELKGYLVLTATDGLEAMQKIMDSPDLILLDINMPYMDGLEVCEKIRDRISCPILFLTARVEEQDKVNGLLSGGDDYIVKPFGLKELDARITAHLKREERDRRKSRMKYQDGLVIDYVAKEVFYGEKKLELTGSEFAIVEYLSRNPGQVFDKERIYEHIRGFDKESDSRVITELVRRIRNKLSACGAEEYIKTVWGMGYKWEK